MKLLLFLFQGLERVSPSYHSGGGLVVVAENERHAKELIAGDEYIEIPDEEWKTAKVYELQNENEQPTYYVFPDAGCC